MIAAWWRRHAAERRLGVRLPAEARDVRHVSWRPSTDLAYAETLIRFDAPEGAYLALIARRRLTRVAEAGGNPHLPTPWAASPGMRAPDWWDPASDTPPDAAAGTVGAQGSIAAKWERGRVYVRIVDTGHPSAPTASSAGGRPAGS